MSFLRHSEIYRSDVGMKTILSLAPSAASRWSARRQDKGRGFNPAPFPSSAMSLGLGIPWQVALQQSLPPLPQPEPVCNDKDSSVEQFSADGTCLTDSVSQNFTQSTNSFSPLGTVGSGTTAPPVPCPYWSAPRTP